MIKNYHKKEFKFVFTKDSAKWAQENICGDTSFLNQLFRSYQMEVSEDGAECKVCCFYGELMGNQVIWIPERFLTEI